MRRKLAGLFPLAALVVAVGLFPTPSASGQTVVHLVVDSGGKAAFFDLHQDGLRLGDRIAARGPLVNEARTERLGTAYLQCLVHRRIIEPNRGLWNCNYVLELEDGEIMLQGLDPRGPGVYEMAIFGGTGAYAGATGDATFTDIANDNEMYTDIVLRLGG